MNFNIPAAATPAQLLALYADILTELRQRGIARSANNPAADYAEYLVAKALDLELATNSTAGYDATDPATGLRYQVKGRRPNAHNPSRQLGAIRNLHERHFDYLAGVLFAEDFSVMRACLIPSDIIEREAKYIAHTNSWMLHLRDSLWSQDGVRDITAAVRAAALGVNGEADVDDIPDGRAAAAITEAMTNADGIATSPAPTTPIENAEMAALTVPKVTYTFSRFCFKADYIEPLALTDAFRMVTKHHGTFQITKEEFYRDFPTLCSTKSYRAKPLIIASARKRTMLYLPSRIRLP